MRKSGGAIALFAGVLLGLLPMPAAARPITITAMPIVNFRGAAPGQPVDELLWRGGLELNSSDPEFGGLSDITFVGAGGELAMVTDEGFFVSTRLLTDDDGAPLALAGSEITAIKDARGNDLGSAYTGDAEALDTIWRGGAPAAVRVGFENLTRVDDFDLAAGRPAGPARPVAIPDWLGAYRGNQSLESVCIATDASPIAGSTLLITEQAPRSGEDAWLLGRLDRGPVHLARANGLSPTACAFGPGGELYILERGVALFSFRMQLRRIPADQVVPGATLTGEVILSASGGEIDNMEGLAVSTGPAGETILTMISDDNFNDFERTLLLQFTVPD